MNFGRRDVAIATVLSAAPSLFSQGDMDTKTICEDLWVLRRDRQAFCRARQMQQCWLEATVASRLGFDSGQDEKARKAKFKEAAQVIKARGEDHPILKGMIEVASIGIDAFTVVIKKLEKKMVELAEQLPVFDWLCAPEQKGFGVLMLAIIVGEAGDLANYPNPGKLWKRMGCAPFQFGSKNLMGGTWRRGMEGKLPAEEWMKFGYSPRRRSIAYNLADCLVKMNKLTVGEGGLPIETVPIDAGPYRQRFLDAKASAAEKHPDWSPKRCQLHGMLLAAKLALKNLWIAWNPKLVKPEMVNGIEESSSPASSKPANGALKPKGC